MNRGAVKNVLAEDVPKNKLAPMTLTTVLLLVGYNLLTEEEYAIVMGCSYTKDMFGLGGWFTEHNLPENVNDTLIRAFLPKCEQPAFLLWLKGKAQAKELIDRIQEMLPRRTAESEDFEMPKDVQL
jgi:hypothetical protein